MEDSNSWRYNSASNTSSRHRHRDWIYEDDLDIIPRIPQHPHFVRIEVRMNNFNYFLMVIGCFRSVSRYWISFVMLRHKNLRVKPFYRF